MKKYRRNPIRYIPVSTLKIFAFTIIILAFCLPVFSQNFYPMPAPVNPALEKQLIQQLSKNRFEEKKIKILLGLSNLFFNKPGKVPQNLDKALYYGQLARGISKKNHDDSGYNQAQILIANIYLFKENISAAEKILNFVDDSTQLDILLAISYCSRYSSAKSRDENVIFSKKIALKARELSLQLHDRKKGLHALLYLSDVNASVGNLAGAEKEIQYIILQYKSIKYPYLHYCYDLLRAISFINGNYDKALFYSLETIKSMNATGDYIGAAYFYSSQGTLFSRIGLFEKALNAFTLRMMYSQIATPFKLNVFSDIPDYINLIIKLRSPRKALDILKQTEKKNVPVTIEDKIAIIDAYGNCYLALRNYALAEKYYLKGFNMDRQANMASFQRMGYFYVEIKNFAKARPYLLKALKLQEPTTSMNAKGHLNYMLFLADSASGNYLSAIKYLNINKRYDDTMYQETKTREIQRMLVRYDTEKKNQEIISLKQKDLLQLANLEQATTIRNVTIGWTLIMFLVGALLYRQYRQKQKYNQVIVQKNVMQEELLNKQEDLLKDKEWLLKEIHHRVKNNLQIAVSLMDLQSNYLPKGEALTAIKEVRSRMNAMSLIHQKLYMSESMVSINMAPYIRELTDYLIDTFSDGNKINIRFNVYPVELDVSQAVPIGLILNEAITNSIKYAFDKTENPVIEISLEQKDISQLLLTIKDNGSGLENAGIVKNSASIGMALMEILSRQLNGDISFCSENGLTITVNFKKEEISKNKKEDFSQEQTATYQ